MIIEYLTAVISGMILDGIWLGVISKPIYERYIGDFMTKKPHLFPALLFYLIFGAAAVVFIVSPALKGQWGTWTVVWHAALLGLVIYGAYDLTNLAILKDWPLAISIIDMAWGIAFSILVSVITLSVSKLVQ